MCMDSLGSFQLCYSDLIVIVNYVYVLEMGMFNFLSKFFHVFGGSLDGHISQLMSGYVIETSISREMKSQAT